MQNILLMMGGMLFLLVTALVIYAFVRIGKAIDRRNRLELEACLEQYRNALRGTDKMAALEAGRKYYYKLRGDLTMSDEQAIANDLSTMK